MHIENINTTLINDSTYQYEVTQMNHVEDAEAPVDINRDWKEENRMCNVSLHMMLANNETRTQITRGFVRGHRSADELKQCIMETIREAYDYGMEEGARDRINDFLNTLYHALKNTAVQVAEGENLLEGRAISREYGTSEDTFAYYNSKYYYALEEACELYRSCFEEFAQEEGLQDFECEESYHCSTFNGAWAARHQTLKIINTEVDPPRNFIFFYGKNYANKSEIFFVNGISADPTERSEELEKKWRVGKCLNMYDYANALFSGRISEQEDFLDSLHYLKNFRIISLERILFLPIRWI